MSTTDDTNPNEKHYRCQFYYRSGDDFGDCLDAAEAIDGLSDAELIPEAFRIWAGRMELGAQHARQIAKACTGLKLDVEWVSHFAGLIAKDEEAAAVLDGLVEAKSLFADDAEHEEDEDEDEDEDEEDDRLDPANYTFWSPLSGKPTSDYNVFVAETIDQAQEVLRKWTTDEHVIVALLPTEVEAVCWQNPMSHEVIALFPMGLAKEELIDAYVAFLAQEP